MMLFKTWEKNQKIEKSNLKNRNKQIGKFWDGFVDLKKNSLIKITLI